MQSTLMNGSEQVDKCVFQFVLCIETQIGWLKCGISSYMQLRFKKMNLSLKAGYLTDITTSAICCWRRRNSNFCFLYPCIISCWCIVGHGCQHIKILWAADGSIHKCEVASVEYPALKYISISTHVLIHAKLLFLLLTLIKCHVYKEEGNIIK